MATDGSEASKLNQSSSMSPDSAKLCREEDFSPKSTVCCKGTAIPPMGVTTAICLLPIS